MKVSSEVEKPVRRKQADRSAGTRGRILDATISALYRLGYAAVTISIVAKEAGVSRGIIGYHFATKADLMVAVRDAVHLEERRLLDETRAKIGSKAYFRDLPRYVVAGMRREPAIAVDEILLAARGEPELTAKLRATEQEIDARALADLKDSYKDVGLEPPPNLSVIMRVWTAAFRGLVISDLVLGDEAATEESIEYMSRLLNRELDTYAAGRANWT